MFKLKAKIYELPEFQTLEKYLHQNSTIRISGIYGSFLSFVLNYIQEVHPRPQLIVLPDGDAAEKLVSDLRIFLPENQVSYFPSDEVVPFDKGIFSPALYSMRLHALTQTIEHSAPILVTTPPALLRRTPDPESIQQNILNLKVGEEFERELLLEWLVESGYERVSIIEEIGQFSARGGIVDVFSFESEYPCRIEYFGDTIDSIRYFDVLSQLSTEKVEQIRLLGRTPEDDETSSLLDYFPKESILWLDDSLRLSKQLDEWWEEAEKRYEEKRGELSIASLEAHYVPLPILREKMDHFQQIIHEHLLPKEKCDVVFPTTAPAMFQGNIKLLIEHLKKHLSPATPSERREIYILYEDSSTKNRLTDILEAEMGIMPPVLLEDGEVHEGFYLPPYHIEVLTAHEIFNRLRMQRKKKRVRISASLIRNLQTLNYGDYVVHVDYGVGKYMGTEKITVAGVEKECLKLIYADNDVLYVTLDKLNRIQRYVGEEGFQPKLTKLGSVEWEKTKDKTRKAVENIARELVELYAKRLASEGYSFSPDTLWQKELEAAFPFEETIDQHRAIEEVKKDMESPRSMDRLICGDVGYGKTEVAIRAAFKAVMDGKQVAVLVPTTILAQQHFNTFTERMYNFPVNIEVLSRFRSRRQQNDIIHRLAEGDVDIIIGTHRLLSEDVRFKDLGLLIIDEEQRFGVRHKEKLRQLKTNVDTITLTATPIPRTLHMSLMGARDLSIVDTPPGNRHPIVTEITTWDAQLIYKA
ncbi:MAG: DEAD/DEAH box helicase, partial [Calditrichaeota bacterium]